MVATRPMVPTRMILIEGSSIGKRKSGPDAALRTDELFRAFDNPHFLRAPRRGALQHGEDGRDGMAERLRRVFFPNARGHVERGEKVTGAVRADRQFRRARAPGFGPF